MTDPTYTYVKGQGWQATYIESFTYIHKNRRITGYVRRPNLKERYFYFDKHKFPQFEIAGRFQLDAFVKFFAYRDLEHHPDFIGVCFSNNQKIPDGAISVVFEVHPL